jgi:hypothetical protein
MNSNPITNNDINNKPTKNIKLCNRLDKCYVFSSIVIVIGVCIFLTGCSELEGTCIQYTKIHGKIIDTLIVTETHDNINTYDGYLKSTINNNENSICLIKVLEGYSDLLVITNDIDKINKDYYTDLYVTNFQPKQYSIGPICYLPKHALKTKSYTYAGIVLLSFGGFCFLIHYTEENCCKNKVLIQERENIKDQYNDIFNTNV